MSGDAPARQSDPAPRAGVVDRPTGPTASAAAQTGVAVGAFAVGGASGRPRPQALEAPWHLTTHNSPGIADAINEISERASLLVREEIELAKAEVTQKVSSLVKGAVVGPLPCSRSSGSSCCSTVLGLVAWWARGRQRQISWGFFIVAGVLFVLGGLAGLIAAKPFKRGTPPVPAMAIDEAKKTKETVVSRSAGGRAPATVELAVARLMADGADPPGDPRVDRAQPPRAGRPIRRLRGEVGRRLARAAAAHRRQAVIGAAVAGFVIGGGVAAVGGLFRRRH